jgi:hypothetical protein
MQLPPQIGMPAARAIAARRFESGGVRSSARKPEAKITAARAPIAMASASVSSSRSLRTESTARSGGAGRSWKLGTQGYGGMLS